MTEQPDSQPAWRKGTPRVSIAICTQRRPVELARLLAGLAEHMTLSDAALLTEVLVVDNDAAGGALPVVQAAEVYARLPLVYLHEAREGFAFARNAALRGANGDVLVFIDDDELPGDDWPEGLIDLLVESGAAMVGGPVHSKLPEDSPAWVRMGGYFDRPIEAHGSGADWLRTGNLAVDLRAIRAIGLCFDERFNRTGGEDVAFSRKAAAEGLGLVWSERGSVVEYVPIERCTARWILTRERTSSTSYARARVLAEGRRRAALGLVPRIGSTVPRAAVRVLIATARRYPRPLLAGQLLLARGRGQIDGLLSEVTA